MLIRERRHQPVLEHDVLISLDVVHVNPPHFLLAVRVERQTVPADMGEEEASLKVERIFFGLGELVVNAMDLNPVVDRGLQVAKRDKKDYSL